MSPRAFRQNREWELGNLPALETGDRGIEARLPDPFSSGFCSKRWERRKGAKELRRRR